jgi:cyclohexyl-isocyanide hydratase
MRILVPVYQGFDLLDLCGPSEMFNWAGYTVDLVAEAPGKVAANNGFVFEVPNGLRRRLRRTTRCGFPGARPTSSRGSSTIRRSATSASSPSRRRRAPGCARSAKARCSRRQQACSTAAMRPTHWAFIPYLIQNYPNVKVADGHPRFVVDGNRLTGGGISSGLDEALQLITLLSGEDHGAERAADDTVLPGPAGLERDPNVITTPMMPPPS